MLGVSSVPKLSAEVAESSNLAVWNCGGGGQESNRPRPRSRTERQVSGGLRFERINDRRQFRALENPDGSSCTPAGVAEDGYSVDFFEPAGNTVTVATLPASALRRPF